MIYLGADHAGFVLKEKIKQWLKKSGYSFKDLGAQKYDPNDDYPDIVKKVADAVSHDPVNSRGIIIGGSGQAEMIVANKFPGVRCVLFYTPAVPTEAADIKGRKSNDPFEIIRLTREHNNANMLSLGARFLRENDALTAINKWLKEPFPNHERHARRINKIAQIEKELSNDGCCGGGCCGEN